jgi:hypothetical protein
VFSAVLYLPAGVIMGSWAFKIAVSECKWATRMGLIARNSWRFCLEKLSLLIIIINNNNNNSSNVLLNCPLDVSTQTQNFDPVPQNFKTFKIFFIISTRIQGETLQLWYLEVTVQVKLRSGWPGPFVKVEGCCEQSFVCFQCEQTSQVQLWKPENACTAFPSTLVSMLELSSPLPVLLLLRVGGLSRLNTRALLT